MALPLQPNILNKVSYRTLDWRELVIREWGTQWRMPDIAYEMKNARKFESTDQYTTGIYGISGYNFLMIDEAYPDMASNSHMLQDSLDRIRLE